MGRDTTAEVKTCQECQKLEEVEEQNSSSEVCKVETKEHSEEEYKYDCDEDYDLTVEQDGDHMESESTGHQWSQGGHKCPWCEEAFTSNGTLTYHKKTKHFYGSFKCKMCNFKGSFAQDLVRHMQVCRFNISYLTSDLSLEPACKVHVLSKEN